MDKCFGSKAGLAPIGKRAHPRGRRAAIVKATEKVATPMKKRPAKKRPAQPRAETADPTPAGLTPQQYAFCLAYLQNGFNATQAYLESHPGCSNGTAQVNGHKSLRIAKIRTFLNQRLEAAWKPLQMGGEQALARVALLAEETEDERVKLAALRTILEQSGKLKSVPDSIDALAAALRADLLAHKDL